VIDYTVKNIQEPVHYSQYSKYVMGIDIGGTHTNLCIAGIAEQKPQILFSLHFNTQQLESLQLAIEEALIYSKQHHNIVISSAGIGAAGVVSPNNDYATLTNVSWNISQDELLEETSLSSATIINDFQALGYGINFLSENNSQDLQTIRQRIEKDSILPRAILGAGTGLGKSILHYHTKKNTFIPYPSEGGHADVPVYSPEELDLLAYIKTKQNISNPVTYEEILSGRGLEHIYYFIRETTQSSNESIDQEIDKSMTKTSLISKYKTTDKICQQTFDIFSSFYARCAKNFILDTMARGGLYIAGGIVVKNPEIVTSDTFMSEFENVYRRKDILHTVPIFLVTNYDVSLYGACYAAIALH